MDQDQELIDKAIRRYARDCEAAGAIYQEPANTSYVRADGVVVLENVRGVLAVYRPTTDAAGRVRFELHEDAEAVE